MSLPIFRHLALIAAVGAATPAAAQSFQDVEAMEQRVTAALGAGVGEPGGPARPIDRRLRLATCPAALTVEPPVMGAATIRCEPLGWRIRVPLMRDADAATVTYDRPAASAPAPRAARAEPVVRRGDPVSLVVMSGNFMVSRQATADQDGAPGQRIRVRTEARSTPIIGEVLPDGRILLSGFN